MTDDIRAQVVELLRCAADDCLRYDTHISGLYSIAEDLGLLVTKRGTKVFRAARDARQAASLVLPPLTSYEVECLEAAQLVEEGSWP